MRTNLFLSRKQYDKMIDDCPQLLMNVIKSALSKRWSLAGVLYKGVPDNLYIAAQKAIN